MSCVARFATQRGQRRGTRPVMRRANTRPTGGGFDSLLVAQQRPEGAAPAKAATWQLRVDPLPTIEPGSASIQ